MFKLFRTFVSSLVFSACLQKKIRIFSFKSKRSPREAAVTDYKTHTERFVSKRWEFLFA